jgi:hypothetical protein
MMFSGAEMAQLIEHITRKDQLGQSSIPRWLEITITYVT